MGIRKKIFSERAVRHRTAAQGGGAVTVPGGVQSCGDVALRDMGSGHGGDGLTVECGDLRGLFEL